MAAMSASPASRFVPPAWFAISAATRTRRRWPRPRSRNDLRLHVKRVEADNVGRHGCAARQRLDMAHGLNSAKIVEEEESAARLSVVAPHLRGAVMAHEGG